TNRTVSIALTNTARIDTELDVREQAKLGDLKGTHVYFTAARPGQSTKGKDPKHGRLGAGDAAIVTDPSAELDATKEVWNFFLAQKKRELAESFAARLATAAYFVARAKTRKQGDFPHILVGRLQIEGGGNFEAVNFQDRFLDEGYFVTTCV